MYLLTFITTTIKIASCSNRYLKSKNFIFSTCSLLIVVEDNRDVVAKIQDIVAKNRDKACSLS